MTSLPTPLPLPFERLTALLAEPEVANAPGLLSTFEAWRKVSTAAEDAPPVGGFPVWTYVDPRSGQLCAWGVTALRPNGLTGWFREPPNATRDGSWRIDLNGRVHRGLPWQRARSHATRTLTESYRDALKALAYTPPSSPDWENALNRARGLLETSTGG